MAMGRTVGSINFGALWTRPVSHDITQENMLKAYKSLREAFKKYLQKKWKICNCFYVWWVAENIWKMTPPDPPPNTWIFHMFLQILLESFPHGMKMISHITNKFILKVLPHSLINFHITYSDEVSLQHEIIAFFVDSLCFRILHLLKV